MLTRHISVTTNVSIDDMEMSRDSDFKGIKSKNYLKTLQLIFFYFLVIKHIFKL